MLDERLPAAYRCGVASALCAEGFHVGIRGARHSQGSRVEVVLRRVDGPWLLPDIACDAQGGAVVVALVDDSDLRTAYLAIGWGARGAVPWDVPLEELVAVVRQVAEGFVCLPAATGPLFPRVDPTLLESELLAPEQSAWLRQLADGATVTQIAANHGYSPRTMHRLLARLYRRLGVSSRAQAIALAARCGMAGGPAAPGSDAHPTRGLVAPGDSWSGQREV